MLVSINDLQDALNIDLTSPEGQSLATGLIAAATAWISKEIGFPIESSSVTTYFDGEYPMIWLATGAPVSDLEIAAYNPSTNDYDTIATSYIRHHGDSNEVYVTAFIPKFFNALRATYTTGWTDETLPKDLKQTLIDLVGIKLQAVANYSSDPSETSGEGEESTTPPLKRVSSGGYTEEYGSTEADIRWKAKAAQLSKSIGDTVPPGIEEVLANYRQPFAL